MSTFEKKTNRLGVIGTLRFLDLPVSIINWITDFLSDRFQRVKLVDGCVSEWGSVPSGVPQGTKLGPWLFIVTVMINDLALHDAHQYQGGNLFT